jgi:hypothetical protein
MSMYDYPLKLRFKLLALAPRIIITDAKDREIMFVSQKVFKLKEDIRIYPNQQKEREIYNIQAEKILDFNTRYNFFTADKQEHIGSVKAKGWRSIWKATYMIDDPNGTQTNYITEDNPWMKIGDALFSEIPVVGMFTGYVFHPAYTCYRSRDLEDVSQPVMHLQKENAFFEGVYNISLIDHEMDREEELSALLSFMLMVQFMRRRG